MDEIKRRGRKRHTIRLNDLDDTKKEETENMAEDKQSKSEEVINETPIKDTPTNQVESLSINDSPIMEKMIERKGGDDFLYKDQPQIDTTQQQQIPKEEPQNNTNTTNTAQQNNAGGPKEFVFDPIQQATTNSGTATPDSTTPPTDTNTNPIPAEIADESSKMIAEMLIEGFSMITPELAERYSKINEGQIRKLERDDKIDPGLVEIAKNVNKANKGAVKVTNDQKNLIRKPLIKVLEVQGVKASPESMLIIAILAVCVMMFIQARSIKRENDDMVKSWMADHSQTRNLQKENAELRKQMAELRSQKEKDVTISDAPYAEVVQA